MPACLALVTAVSTSASVCSFFNRSSTFWLPLSMPNMSVRQWALAIAGNRCWAVESTRPSQPHWMVTPASLMPLQIASMRFGCSRK